MKDRNWTIDFFKLYYSFFIVAYHYFLPTKSFFSRGNSAVSFFLIASGLFLFHSFERQGSTVTPNKFFIFRFKRFFPSVFISYIFAHIIFRVIISPKPVSAYIDFFVNDIWELLLIKMNGMNNNTAFLNSPVWTISSIFLVGCVFWCLLYTCKSVFTDCILPISLIVLFGYYLHMPSRSHEVWIGFTTAGTVRAYCMMGLGYYCLLISRHISRVEFTVLGSIVLTCIELLCHLFVLWSVNFRSTSGYEWFNTLLFCISIAIAFSGKSFVPALLSRSRISKYLAEVSMSVYLVHRPIISLMSFVYGSPDYIKHGYLFIAILAIAVLLHIVLTRGFVNCCRKVGSAIEKGIIREKVYE